MDGQNLRGFCPVAALLEILHDSIAPVPTQFRVCSGETPSDFPVTTPSQIKGEGLRRDILGDPGATSRDDATGLPG